MNSLKVKCLFISICVAGFINKSNAQFFFNNGQVITTTNQVVLTVNGDAENTGIINQEGEFYLAGNWINTGGYVSGDGSLYLIGESDQLISHNNQDMPNLILNGLGNKVLMTPLTISTGGSIDFINGVMFSTETNTFLIEDAVNVTGGSDDSFVDGPMYTMGNGFKYLPIGKGSWFGGIELENVTGSNPTIGYEVFNDNPNPIIDFQLNLISNDRHWERRIRSGDGSFTGSIVSLYVSPLESFSSIRDLSVAQSGSLGDLFLPIGQGFVEGSIADGGWITSQDPAINKILAIGSISGTTLEQLIFVPNVFSPSSADPEEQVLKVYGRDILEEGFEFKIFNRWGGVEYATNSFIEANTSGWNGVINANSDETKTESVYKYFLRGVLINGKSFSRQGSIRLLK